MADAWCSGAKHAPCVYPIANHTGMGLAHRAASANKRCPKAEVLTQAAQNALHEGAPAKLARFALQTRSCASTTGYCVARGAAWAKPLVQSNARPAPARLAFCLTEHPKQEAARGVNRHPARTSRSVAWYASWVDMPTGQRARSRHTEAVAADRQSVHARGSRKPSG